jgi:MFS family permease
MFSAILAYGLGHSTGLAPWRALFLTAGLMTILTAPVIWLVHDSDISTARFYTPKEKEQAVERLRANQTGTGSSEFKWHQILEIFYDTKTYLWLAMSLLLNVGAAVTNIFVSDSRIVCDDMIDERLTDLGTDVRRNPISRMMVQELTDQTDR